MSTEKKATPVFSNFIETHIVKEAKSQQIAPKKEQNPEKELYSVLASKTFRDIDKFSE